MATINSTNFSGDTLENGAASAALHRVARQELHLCPDVSFVDIGVHAFLGRSLQK